MKKFLFELVMKLLPYIRPEQGDLWKRAVELVKWAESLNISGDRKRSQVYNRLVAEFPDIAKRVIGLTIEQVVQELD